jgi:hypothetical protein
MAASLTAKTPFDPRPEPERREDQLQRARAIARACYAVLKHRMSFDRKTMQWLAELKAGNEWLEE